MDPEAAVIMGQFKGKRVCGKPASVTFLTMVRPDIQGQCPSGYSPCNDHAVPDNLVCLETDDPTG